MHAVRGVKPSSSSSCWVAKHGELVQLPSKEADEALLGLPPTRSAKSWSNTSDAVIQKPVRSSNSGTEPRKPPAVSLLEQHRHSSWGCLASERSRISLADSASSRTKSLANFTRVPDAAAEEAAAADQHVDAPASLSASDVDFHLPKLKISRISAGSGKECKRMPLVHELLACCHGLSHIAGEVRHAAR